MDSFYIKHKTGFRIDLTGDDNVVREFALNLCLDNNDFFYIIPKKIIGNNKTKIFYNPEDVIKAGLGDANAQQKIKEAHDDLGKEFHADDMFDADALDDLVKGLYPKFKEDFEKHAPVGENLPKLVKMQTVDDFQDAQSYANIFRQN